MEVIKQGSTYNIFNGSIEACGDLPSGTYKIAFNPQMGYSLIKRDDLVQEGKIYGNTQRRVDKMINSYNRMDRSMGIILSGAKGIGKTLFVRLMAMKTTAMGLPIILVEKNTPGLPQFLDSIKQEVVIVFDEFEKVFPNYADDDETINQSQFLSLFDGTSSQKRMYVLTVNDPDKLNDYFLNRPGRFHYHLRFKRPVTADIKEYLKDHLNKEFQGEISSVVSFSHSVKLTFDMLRSIAFELNGGASFNEAIKDLNITRNGYTRYMITVFTKAGEVTKMQDTLDLFKTNVCIDGYPFEGRFKSSDLKDNNDTLFLQGKDIERIQFQYVGIGDPLRKMFKNVTPENASGEVDLSDQIDRIEFRPEDEDSLAFNREF